jgi:transcriptional regulator with XRE-family HTH domain
MVVFVKKCTYAGKVMERFGRGRASADSPDPIDIEVGQNLRQARLARGYSQTELGEALGISFQQVQKYERGTNRLSASRLVRAARFLRIGCADLLPPEDQHQTPPIVNRLAEVSGLVDVVDAYCAVSDPTLRRDLLNLLRVLKPKAAVAEESPADGLA